MSPYVPLILAVFLGSVVVLGQSKDPVDFRRCSFNTTIQDCCKMPKLVDSSVLKKCKGGGQGGPPKTMDHGRDGPRGPPPCMSECIVTSMGGLTNGKLNPTGFKNSLQPIVQSNPTFATAISSAVDQCFQASSAPSNSTTTSPVVQGPRPRPGCSPTANDFLNCVHQTVFQNCPDTAQTQNQACSLLASKLADGCPFFIFTRPGNNLTMGN